MAPCIGMAARLKPFISSRDEPPEDAGSLSRRRSARLLNAIEWEASSTDAPSDSCIGARRMLRTDSDQGEGFNIENLALRRSATARTDQIATRSYARKKDRPGASA